MSLRNCLLGAFLFSISFTLSAQVFPSNPFGANLGSPNNNIGNFNSSSVGSLNSTRSVIGRTSQKQNIDSLNFKNNTRISGSEINNGAPNSGNLNTMSDVQRKEDSVKAALSKKIFGMSLFNSEKLSFEPNIKIATPKNYILGPDDQLIVDINGYSEDHFNLTVTPDGFVRINKIGNVYVSGLNIEEAKARIIKKLSSIYVGLRNVGSGPSPTNLYATISLGNIRTVSVIVQGEVQVPGNYSVSSLSRIMNVLYLAGGPTINGNLRAVKLIRGGKEIASLDLYDYLLFGYGKNDLPVQDQDVIFVEVFKNRVELAGKFKRPMIFEVLPNEKLDFIIERLGGGFSDDGHKESVKITRYTDKERKLLDVNSSFFANFYPASGDIITADGIDINRFENRISINGEIWRPGDFSLEYSPTLKSLISNAGGFKDAAFLDRILITRQNPDLTSENLSVNFNKLLKDNQDVTLKREDRVTVFSKFKLMENLEVTIHGEINNNYTGNQALENSNLANGTSIIASSGMNNRVAENKEMASNGTSELDLNLKTDDANNILINRQIKLTFPFEQSLTVEDLILKAGGLRESAKSGVVEVIRRKRNNLESFDLNDNTISEVHKFQISKDLSLDQMASSFKLMPFDEVFVRSSPNYQIQQFITLKGQVLFPGVYGIERKDERISTIINRAGGITNVGYLKGAKLIRRFFVSESQRALDEKRISDLQDNYLNTSIKTNVKTDKNYQEPIGLNLENALANPNGTDDIIIQDGDIIDIPIVPQTVKISGEVIQPNNVKFEPNATFKDFISAAGGFTGSSWRKRAYIVYSNGSIKRTKNFLFFRFHPEIERGAEIIIPSKRKSGNNFQQIASIVGIFTGSLASIIGVVTLIKATGIKF